MTGRPLRPGSEPWIRRMCRRAATVDWKALEQELVLAARRDQTGTDEVDGHKRSHAPGGSGGGATVRVEASDDPEVGVDGEDIPVTSVEAAMFATLTVRRDPVHEHVEAAVGFLSDAVRAGEAMQSRLRQLAAVQDPDPPAKQGPARCAEWRSGCVRRAVQGRRGRCESCWKWIWRWEQKHPGSQAPPVPARTIEQREARESNRVRVSGLGAPTAGELEILAELDVGEAG